MGMLGMALAGGVKGAADQYIEVDKENSEEAKLIAAEERLAIAQNKRDVRLNQWKIDSDKRTNENSVAAATVSHNREVVRDSDRYMQEIQLGEDAVKAAKDAALLLLAGQKDKNSAAVTANINAAKTLADVNKIAETLKFNRNSIDNATKYMQEIDTAEAKVVSDESVAKKAHENALEVIRKQTKVLSPGQILVGEDLESGNIKKIFSGRVVLTEAQKAEEKQLQADYKSVYTSSKDNYSTVGANNISMFIDEDSKANHAKAVALGTIYRDITGETPNTFMNKIYQLVEDNKSMPLETLIMDLSAAESDLADTPKTHFLWGASEYKEAVAKVKEISGQLTAAKGTRVADFSVLNKILSPDGQAKLKTMGMLKGVPTDPVAATNAAVPSAETEVPTPAPVNEGGFTVPKTAMKSEASFLSFLLESGLPIKDAEEQVSKAVIDGRFNK